MLFRETIVESDDEYNNKNNAEFTLTNKKILNSESSNSLMAKTVAQQNEWIRQQLAKLWDENQADYFTNPSRIIHQKKTEIDKNEHLKVRVNHINARHINSKPNRGGLFAYNIWDNIRDDTQNRLKPFDLEKELKKINYYDKVKETMDRITQNTDLKSKIKSLNGLSKLNLAENAANRNAQSNSDFSRMKRARILRNELELMYRSSKLNAEKVNILQSNAELIDLNDNQGKESISRYLPLIDQNQGNSSNLMTRSMEIEELKINQNEDNRKEVQLSNESNELVLLKALKQNKLKNDNQPVRLTFLSEIPYQHYLNQKWNEHSSPSQNEDNELENENNKIVAIYEESKPEIAKQVDKPKKDSLITVEYPPLSMNALMEYKPLIKAPGYGEFKHGKPKLFNMN